jgi:hypothetical protein
MGTAALLIIAGGVAPCTPLAAQTIQGQVVHGIANQTVAGGLVVLLDATAAPIARTQLRRDGAFSLTAPRAGRYAIRFEAPGYTTVTSDWLDLRAGATLVVTLRASPLASAELDTVFVRGEPVPFRLAPFYERRARGAGGEFFTPEDIERRKAQTPTEVLRYSIGFNVVPNPFAGRTTMTQKYFIVNRRFSRVEQETCPPLIFVDGVYVGNAGDVEVDTYFDGPWLGAVEAYPGAASIPPEYNRQGARCGVIGLWSNWAQGGGSGVSRALYLGAQAGTSVSGPFDGELVGVHAIIALGRIAELVTMGSVSLDAPDGWTATGWQASVAIRVRPLGLRTPWYVGVGGGVLERDELAFVTPGAQTGREYVLFLTGAAVQLGRAHPFVQVEVLDPFPVRNADLQVYVGASYRVY